MLHNNVQKQQCEGKSYHMNYKHIIITLPLNWLSIKVKWHENITCLLSPTAACCPAPFWHSMWWSGWWYSRWWRWSRWRWTWWCKQSSTFRCRRWNWCRWRVWVWRWNMIWRQRMVWDWRLSKIVGCVWCHSMHWGFWLMCLYWRQRCSVSLACRL